MKLLFKKPFLLLLLTVCSFAPSFSFAQTDTGSDEERVRVMVNFLAASKLKLEVVKYWTALAEQLNSAAALKRMDSRMSSKKADEYLIDFLLDNYNRPLFEAGAEWFKNPLSIRYVKLADIPLDKFDSFVRDDVSRLSTKRRELLLRAIAATDANTQAKAVFQITTMAMSVAGGMGLSQADLLAQLSFERDKQKIVDNTFHLLAFRTREISDEELEALVNHLEQPESRWVLAVTKAALVKTIYAMIVDMSKPSNEGAGDSIRLGKPVVPTATQTPSGVNTISDQMD